MRRWIACLLTLMLSLSATVGLADHAISELGCFVEKDGVVYWVGKSFAIAVRLLNQESIRILGTIEGVPVSIEHRDDLFETNTARELIIEKLGKESSAGFHIKDWPNLERVVFEGTDWPMSDIRILGCRNLAELTFPDRISTGENGFSEIQLAYLDKLRSLTLPACEDSYYFEVEACDALESLIFSSESYLPYSLSVFSAMPRLSQVVFAENTKKATLIDGVVYGRYDGEEGPSLLLYPSGLVNEELAIAEGTRNIAYRAIGSAPNLLKIHLPASLETFDGLCSPQNLESVQVHPENPWYKDVDGILFSKDGKTLYTLPNGSREEYEVPKGVEILAFPYYVNNDKLRKVTLPEGYQRLEASQLDAYKALEEIRLPASIQYIDPDVFYGMSTLRSITVSDKNKTYRSIGGALFTKDGKELLCLPAMVGPEYTVPEGTERINVNAFGKNGILERLILPQSLLEFNPYKLSSHDHLREIQVAEGNSRYASVDGVLYDKDKKNLLAYPSIRDLAYDVLPGTENIGPYAFAHNEFLQVVNLPQSVKSIGDYAFLQCGALASISLPMGLKHIGEYAFDYCPVLESIVLPKGLETIAGSTFTYYGRMEEIWLPPDALFFQGDFEEWARYTTSFVVDRGSASQAWLDEKGISYRLQEDALSMRPSVYQDAVLGRGLPEERIAIRETVDGASSIVSDCPAGTGAKVIGVAETCYRVMVGDALGYVDQKAIILLPESGNDTVFSRGTMLTSSPIFTYACQEAAELTRLEKGHSVTLIDLEGVWYRVKKGEVEGYIPAQTVLPVRSDDSDEYYRALGAVICPNEAVPAVLHSYPADGAPLLSELYSGAILFGLREAKDWFYVRTMDGLYGFIRSENFKMIDPIYGVG